MRAASKRSGSAGGAERRARRAGLAACLAAASVAAACATGGATRIPGPPEVPPAWSRAGGQSSGQVEDLARWWERLGDAGLTRLIGEALAGSPDLRTARSRLNQARAQRALAAASRLPSVAGTSSGSAIGSGGTGQSVSVSAGIDASWEADLSGSRRSALVAAEADRAAAEEDLRAARVSLASEVAIDYVELRSLQARLGIARGNLASQEETLQLTRWRAQAGLVSGLDVERARANFEQTRGQIPSLESSIAQTEHRLAVLAGRRPADLVATLDEPGPIPTAPDRLGIGIPADTLRQRPDLRAAERRIVAETARLSQAKAARYPTFTLRGSLGLERAGAAVGGGVSLVASLAGSLLQTIFDGGRIGSQIEIQGETLEQAVAAYEASVLAALEEVENALVAIEATGRRLAALEEAARAARSSASLARQQYTAGLSDFQSVLDTERTVLSIEDGVATSQASRVTALIQLYKALGGGWSASAPATPTTSPAGRP